jgi:3'-phosphoadenosine 5'-phosphosulfate synthase
LYQLRPGIWFVKVLPFRVAAYDRRSKSMEFFDSKRADDFVFISGTKMRGFAKNGWLCE